MKRISIHQVAYSNRSNLLNKTKTIIMRAIFEYIHGIPKLTSMSGLKERVNHPSLLLWISL